jgi:DNA-directed RNA polymerase specialized sigma24 family protein
MQSDGSVTHWLRELRAGNRTAAQQLWEGYFERLVRLARWRLQTSRRRVADEQDVALSAFDSFCRGAEQGRFPQLESRDDLWQILVVLTARKAMDLLAYERRQKRGGGQVRGESAFGDVDEAGIEQIVGDEPDPEFAAQVSEECGRLLGQLDAELRVIALGKLEGYTNPEIAARLGCAPATIERRLRLIRSIWSQEREA